MSWDSRAKDTWLYPEKRSTTEVTAILPNFSENSSAEGSRFASFIKIPFRKITVLMS